MRTFFIVLAAFFAVSFAAPSKTAEEYVRLALKANPDIRSVQYAYKAALEEAPINSTLPDPMIMTEGRGIPTDPGNFGETREWMFMLEQRIPFPGKLSHMQQKSEINALEMEFNSDDVRNKIIKWVEQTVYRIAYLDKVLEINQKQIDWMQRFEESVKSRYTVGSATRQEWLKAGIELQHLLAERIALEERRTNQVRLLNRLLDRRLDYPVAVESLPSDLPLIPEEELDSLLTHNNPALLAAQQRQRYAGVDVGLAKLSRYPDIALMGGFMVMNNMDDRLMGRISLTLPFLPWSGKDSGAGIESAKIMKSKSILDYHYLREKLLQQLFNVSSSLRSIQRQKALYDEEILQSYQQLIELSLADYKTITAWVGGRITELYVDYTGLTVEKGQPLLQLYSPDLYVAQKEYLQAVQSASNAYLHRESMSKKLLFYGLTAEQVDSLEKSGQADPYTIIRAPIGGVVLKKKALNGEYVQTGTVLYEIADLRRVWVYLSAYETDLPFLQKGQVVSFQLKAFPGKQFDGKIDFIDPVLDPKSRTIKVRVIAANHDLKLKPGLLVKATVFIKKRPREENPLVIPASAALLTGERAVVYVADASKEGVFAGREVVLGERLNDHFVVARGLTSGERVVTNGAFKIDSEMQIRAKKSMMNPQGDEGMPSHAHAEMASTEQPQHRDGETQTEQSRQKKRMPEDFYEQLEMVIGHYYTVQQALSQDDGEKGAEAAENLKTAVAAMNVDYDHGWAEIYGKLERSAEALAVTENINKERKAFERLSDTLIQIVSAYGIPEDMVVEQYHCPMAFDDKGADWLSNRGKVENPYYGSQMFRCGSKVKSFSDTETKDSEHE